MPGQAGHDVVDRLGMTWKVLDDVTEGEMCYC